MNKKQMLSLFITVALTGLTACSTTTEPTLIETEAASVPTVTEATETTTTEQDTPKDLSPIAFSIYIADADNINFDNEIAKKITEYTGVTLEIISHDETMSNTEEIDLMASSGNLPDLIYAGESTDTLIKRGLLIPLDDYIAKRGNNISSLYDTKIELLKKSDGHIYTFGTNSDSNTNFAGTFQIQIDVLKEAGYPEITTLSKLEECIASYADSHQWINDSRVIGFSFCNLTKDNRIIFENKINSLLGYENTGNFIINDETGKAVYKWTDPRVKEFYRWLNHIYNRGLLDENAFSHGHEKYESKLASGNVLAAADTYENISAANELLPEERKYFPLAVTYDENTLSPELINVGFSGEDGIAITSSCKNSQRAFEFMDWFCSDEAQVLINWGIEGKNYTINTSNRRIFTKEELERRTEENYAQTYGIGLYTYPFPTHDSLSRDKEGLYYTPDAYLAERTQSESDALQAYDILTAAELFPRESPIFNYTLDPQDISSNIEAEIIQSTLEVYISTETANAVMCTEDEFDAKWQEIMDWLTVNRVDRLNELVTGMVKQK